MPLLLTIIAVVICYSKGSHETCFTGKYGNKYLREKKQDMTKFNTVSSFLYSIPSSILCSGNRRKQTTLPAICSAPRVGKRSI